jgi:hypothetical protein
MSAFVVRGVVAAGASHADGSGRFTYLSEVAADWYQWNGAHRATHFASEADGMRAAALCKGPWFNHPDPESVETVPVE